jgi:hypothetical protein
MPMEATEILTFDERLKRCQKIFEYAKEVAGTLDDLDLELEASSLEIWQHEPEDEQPTGVNLSF